MSDLEKFISFFKAMGVDYHPWQVVDGESGPSVDILTCGQDHFHFRISDGVFLGVESDETGRWHPRKHTADAADSQPAAEIAEMPGTPAPKRTCGTEAPTLATCVAHCTKTREREVREARMRAETPDGTPHVRDVLARCDDFMPGEPDGNCAGDGHYLCDECKLRTPREGEENNHADD